MIHPASDILPKIPGAYIVGGSVRDVLLGIPPLDFDIAVSENPYGYAKKIAAKVSGRLVRIGKAAHVIVRVVSPCITVDISPLSGKSIKEDLQKRDFTINAMAWELCSGKLIDPLGGQKDLAKKIVRMISKRSFVNDPIRLMRAYRVAACLDFTVEPKTRLAIAQYAHLIRAVAGERIREELFRLLRTNRSHGFLCQMADNNLIFEIFPELLYSTGSMPIEATSRNRFAQILEAYRQLEIHLHDPRQLMSETSISTLQHLSNRPKVLLKCCLLWQHISMPIYCPPVDEKHYRTDTHAEQRAATVKDICKKLRFSNRDSDYVLFIIQKQTYLMALFSAYRRKTLKRADISRFFMQCKERGLDLSLLAIANLKGKQIRRSAQHQAFLDFALHMIRNDYPLFVSRASLPPLITGNDLMNELGLKPSPDFKEILSFIEEQRLSGANMTRTQALRLVERYLHHRNTAV